MSGDARAQELAMLEQRYPFIPWRTPIRVQRTDGLERWACRLCIAQQGLKGTDIPALAAERAEVERHIARAHPPAGSHEALS